MEETRAKRSRIRKRKNKKEDEIVVESPDIEKKEKRRSTKADEWKSEFYPDKEGEVRSAKDSRDLNEELEEEIECQNY